MEIVTLRISMYELNGDKLFCERSMRPFREEGMMERGAGAARLGTRMMVAQTLLVYVFHLAYEVPRVLVGVLPPPSSMRGICSAEHLPPLREYAD